jgi:hypothetical protein
MALIIESVEASGIGGVDRFAQRFDRGLQTIRMGPAGGKTRLVRGLRSLLCLDEYEDDLVRPPSGKAGHIEVSMRADDTALAMEKRWKDGNLVRWRAAEKRNKWDLRLEADRMRWKAWAGERIAAFRTGDSYSQCAVYDAMMDLLVPQRPVIRRLNDPGFCSVLLGTFPYLQFLATLREVLVLASERVELYKREERTFSEQLAISAQYRKETERVDLELADLEEMRGKLLERIQKNRKEVLQLDRLSDYVNEKRRELDNVTNELNNHRLLLERGTPELSEDEYRDLEKKTARYERLEKEVVELREKVVELRHLEKNAEGLRKEIADLEKVHEEKDDAGARRQIQIYEAEIRRIAKRIAKFKNLDESIAEKEKEKGRYRETYERHRFIVSSRRILSRSDTTRLKSEIARLDQKRLRLAKELQDMRLAGPEEHRSEEKRELGILEERLAGLEARIRELRSRPRPGQGRRSVGAPVERMTELNEALGQSLSAKRYVEFMQTVFEEIQTRQEEERTEQLADGLRKTIGRFQPESTRHALTRALDLLRLPLREGMPWLADSEIGLFSALLHLHFVRFGSRLSCAVMDEHLQTQLHEETYRQFRDIAASGDVHQVILFER